MNLAISRRNQLTTTTQTLDFSCMVKAPPEDVYYAFTHAAALSEWLCDGSQADPKRGGRLCLWWNSGDCACGEFEELEPGVFLRFVWRGWEESGGTKVEVTLTPQNGSTLVELVQSGLGSGAEWSRLREKATQEWRDRLESLRSVLEEGGDLRRAQRPLLGIGIKAVINQGLARELNLPVMEGVQIYLTTHGVGAAAAGLQEDDIIISCGGAPVRDLPTLAEAITSRSAGDEIEIVFYRGKERKTATARLFRRSTPEVPPMAEALAKTLREVHIQLDTGLARIMEGVTEEEASQPHAEGEWSIKEILAHLILFERDIRLWLAARILGEDIPFLPESPSSRVGAVVATHGTCSNLLRELKMAEAETVAMLFALPDEFVRRKGIYIRAAQTLLGFSHHHQMHFEQIQATLNALRSRRI